MTWQQRNLLKKHMVPVQKNDENSRPIEKDVMLLDLRATEKQLSLKR